MLDQNIINEIDKLFNKVGYKMNYAVFDYATETISIKAKNTVKPVNFPSMDAYALRKA